MCSVHVFAQDVIVKKDGSTVLCRIIEVNSSEVVYKKWSDLKGSNYVMNRSDASSINYQNGKRTVLSEEYNNQYTPGNQNSGVRQMNDNALLRMDYDALNIPAKIKKMKKTAWIGGAILGGAGVALLCAAKIGEDSESADGFIPFGVGGIAVGAIWTGAFLYSAKIYENKAGTMVQNIPVWQNEFRIKEGTSLSAGIDCLKDNMSKNNTLGFALRCNF